MRRALASLAVCAALVPAGGASAISWGVGFGDWSGALGLSLDAGKQSSSSGGGGTQSSSRRLGETLSLNRNYYVLDPRFVAGGLGLQLNLNQESSQGNGGSASSTGRVIGYSFDSTFLAEKPYTGSIFADRSQRQSIPTFGGRMEGTRENRGLALHLRENSVLKDWGMPWFSANLQVRRESGEEKTTVFGQSLTRNDARTALDLDLNKGFRTADLGLRYQVSQVENRDFPLGNYQSRTGQINYSLDFGPTLNRRYDALFNWMNRNGEAPFTLFTADQRLRIEHLQNLSTDYQYGFNRQQAGGGQSTGQSGSFSVTHYLYRNLMTTASVSGTRNSLPNGSTGSYGGSLSQGYQHGLPGRGRMFLNWSGSKRITQNRLASSIITVTDEAHTAPTPIGGGAGFLLDHPFVVVSTIAVVDVRGGLRVTAVPGVDYDLVAEGSQTRVVPRVGSLVILAGDPLLASYDYQVDPSLKYSSTSLGFGGGLDYGWIAASLRHSQSDQTPLSGGEVRFLESSRDDVGQIELRGNWRGVDATANGSFESYSSNTTAYDRKVLGSVFVWRPRYYVSMVVTLNATDTQFAMPARKSSTRSARASLDWQTQGGWSNSAFAELRTHSEGALPGETALQLGARTRVRYGLLAIASGLSFSQFARGGSSSRDIRFDVSAVRSF
ncbi:MAG: hypothetical protein Fur0039_21420 [Rhodocyclaceae bacterium]